MLSLKDWEFERMYLSHRQKYTPCNTLTLSSNVQLTINSHKILKKFNSLCSNKYGVNNVIWMVSNHNLSINGLCRFEAYTVMIVSIAWTQSQLVVNEVLAHLLLILDLLILLVRRISKFAKSNTTVGNWTLTNEGDQCLYFYANC